MFRKGTLETRIRRHATNWSEKHHREYRSRMPTLQHARDGSSKIQVGNRIRAFNYSVQVDTMYLLGKPVLHMIDVATHFCAASFLKSGSLNEIWTSIQ